MPIDQQILQRLQANDSSLTELNLSRQRLTASDMQELVAALQGNTNLKLLTVYDNWIRDEGAKVLAQNQTLTSLDVSHNRIGAAGAKALARNQFLSSLTVSRNRIGDEGAKALGLNQTMTSLNVSSNQIGDKGAKFLAQNQTLTSLNVNHNRIGDEGAKALGLNQTLTSLNVSGIEIGDEGAKALAQNQTLTSLNVYANQIGDEGAKALAQNQTLTSLNVIGNQMGDEVLHQIELMLVVNKQRRRNQFILTLGKVFSRASALASREFALPAELIDYIGFYLDANFYLQLAKIKHPSHVGKTEQQVYQCMLFLLHQFTEGGWVEASLREHQPQENQALDHRRHFTLFNPVSPKANEEELHNPITCTFQ